MWGGKMNGERVLQDIAKDTSCAQDSWDPLQSHLDVSPYLFLTILPYSILTLSLDCLVKSPQNVLKMSLFP